MENINFRALKAEEIEVRVGNCGLSKYGGWCTLLLYKNARTDQNILDETVGQFNWQRKHYECAGKLFCDVSINKNYMNDSIEPLWISKSDCGTETIGDKEKGESSDAFKRACFNWNIGRELYSSPKIFINTEVEWNDRTGRYEPKIKDFYVDEISIIKSSNKVMSLTISSHTKGLLFKWDVSQPLDARPATIDYNDYKTTNQEEQYNYGVEDKDDYERTSDFSDMFSDDEITVSFDDSPDESLDYTKIDYDTLNQQETSNNITPEKEIKQSSGTALNGKRRIKRN